MIEAARKVRELVGQSAFDEFRGRAMTPVANVQSHHEILAWLRGSIETDYHPCGTCRMDNDPLAVVDVEMKVRGLEGLRVVDASVLPKIVSGNLNAPTQMIGERAADFIRGRPQMKPETARFNFRAGYGVFGNTHSCRSYGFAKLTRVKQRNPSPDLKQLHCSTR